MSLGWYFLFALLFLIVVILAVPSDGATPTEGVAPYRLAKVAISLR
jgi:hypothetical protein